MSCKDGAHLFEYRWEGQYRRCKREGCGVAEWAMYPDQPNGPSWLRGVPCGVSYYHPLGRRAMAGVGNSNLGNFKEPIKATPGELNRIASEMEQNFFLKQKELAKKSK